MQVPVRQANPSQPKTFSNESDLTRQWQFAPPITSTIAESEMSWQSTGAGSFESLNLRVSSTFNMQRSILIWVSKPE